MRKIRTVLLAGAMVVGLGAAAGFAASTLGSNSASHALTVPLPGGGTETIAYAGSVAPKVTFHTQQIAAAWPAPFSLRWMAPRFAALDPLIADMDRQFDVLANLPLLMPPVPDRPLSAAVLGSLPAGTSYSMISQATGDGVCTRFTEITKAPGDAKPKIVSQSSGNCQAGSDSRDQAVKAVNLRGMPAEATQSM